MLVVVDDVRADSINLCALRGIEKVRYSSMLNSRYTELGGCLFDFFQNPIENFDLFFNNFFLPV